MMCNLPSPHDTHIWILQVYKQNDEDIIMLIPQTNNRRAHNRRHYQDRRAQLDKAIYSHSQADTIMKITLIGAMILLFAMAIFSSATQAADKPMPNELIENTTEEMLAALKKDKSLIDQQPAHVYQLADKIVLPHFDFNYMSALALGKHWRRATDEQKQRFPQEFRSLLLRTYATALNEYTDEKVVYLPMRGDMSKGDVTISTEIHRQAGPVIPVSYNLHEKDGEWKVYDIKIEGISLVANYRSTFSHEIRRSGMDNLINKLAKKNAKVNGKKLASLQ
jgi:phospholipid transport system substrate-binding protein